MKFINSNFTIAFELVAWMVDLCISKDDQLFYLHIESIKEPISMIYMNLFICFFLLSLINPSRSSHE